MSPVHTELAREMRHDLLSDAARRREAAKRAPFIAKMRELRAELGMEPR